LDSSYAVKVSTNHGDVYGDYVVVSVPLGVLKTDSIAFEPPLPASKQTAIHAMGFGVLDKIIIQFREPFWPRTAQWLCHVPTIADRRDYAYFQNYWPLVQQPVLVCYVNSEFAKLVENKKDPEIVDRILAILGTAFGGESRVRELLVATRVTRWASDPFARGAYANVARGGSAADFDELAKPLPCVHFAGDHTNRSWPGTVHGAFLSGRREARALRMKMGKAPLRRA